jgi:hypothetical protein
MLLLLLLPPLAAVRKNPPVKTIKVTHFTIEAVFQCSSL